MRRLGVLVVALLSTAGEVFALNPPTDLSASGLSARQVILTWTDNSTDDTGFKVERQIGSGAWTELGTTWGGPWVNVLNPSTTYSYRVRAYNGSGDSDYSNTVSVTTPAAPVCGTPPIPPVVNPIPNLKAHVGFPVDFRASVVSPSTCGKSGSWSKVSGPAEFNLDGAGGLFYWTPAQAGDFTIQVKFTRSDGQVGNTTFVAHVDDNTITYPLFRDYLSQPTTVPISGRAWQQMQSYSLYYRPKTGTTAQTLIAGPFTTPVSSTGLLANWNIAGLSDGARVVISLVVQAAGGENSFITDDVILDRTAKAGWPKRTEPLTHSVVVADLDGDGDGEVIAVTHFGKVIVWNIDGSLLWSATIGGGTFSGPSVGDIDGDGKPEIVAGILNKIVAYNRFGQSLPGFPITGPPSRDFRAIPTLADLTGDGVLDIIASSRGLTTSVPGAVLAYTYVGNAPILLWNRPVDYFSLYASPSVADIDHDRSPEVVVADKDRVYAWHADGKEVSGLHRAILPVPVTGTDVAGAGSFDSSSQPAIADLEGDGIMEIIVAGNVFESDGTIKHGWSGGRPGAGASLSAAVADLDSLPGNGLEVVLGGRAWHADGSAYPALTGTYSSVSIGDAEGNGEQYRVMGTRTSDPNAWGIDAFEPDGKRAPGYPKSLYGQTGDVSVPQIGDFDNDGLLDVAVAVTDASYGGIIAIYNSPGFFDPSNQPWPMLGHDLGHTGYTTLCPWFYCGY